MSQGRPPDFRLSIKHRVTGAAGVVGAAWKDDRGFLSIRLNPGVVLSWQDDVYINLFPIEDTPKFRTPRAVAPPGPPSPPEPPPDDDIPF